MKIYDISQEVTGCEVYPGDPSPELIPLVRMTEGELYNLTALRMCTHNGTHVDAPFHFYRDGCGVEKIPLAKFVGKCVVADTESIADLTAEDAREILREVPVEGKRILLKGSTVVTAEAARVFASAGMDLIGTETQSVGPVDAPMEVHKILLGAGVVLLEGIRLGEVVPGEYLLNAAPLNLKGSDGAPCRAILMEF